MLPYLDIVYILISIITFALYSILITKVKVEDTFVFLFWIYTVNHLGFLGIYLFRKFILLHEVFAIEELIRQFTFYNSPLYVLMGLSFLATFLIYAKLISKYQVSIVLPFIQISLLFIVIGYIFLGDPFSWYSLIGALIVCLGAIISPMEHMPGINIFYHLNKLPRDLVAGVLIEAFLIALRAFITFLLIQETPIDKYVMDSLKHVFPFSFVDPFSFNLGARFFIMITFLGYIYIKGKSKNLGKILRDHSQSIVLIGIIYLISCYTYQDAYRLTQDKDVLAALSKLSIPMVLATSVLFLEEELNMQKVLGSILIVSGGLIAILF